MEELVGGCQVLRGHLFHLQLLSLALARCREQLVQMDVQMGSSCLSI